MRTVKGVRYVCSKSKRWQVASSGTSGGASDAVTTTSSTSTTTTTIKPGLPRSAADRPGNREWDVKFIYATFLDGPDNRRDVNGQIAGIAA
ncbi:MAG: hypothetical protein ACKOJH_05680, partial [Actinomycetota bacterium]